MSKADRFFTEAVAGAEKARRIYRTEGGLPGEVHDVVTDYTQVAEFCCKYCLTRSAIRPPAQSTIGCALVRCEHCGDLTRIEFHSPA